MRDSGALPRTRVHDLSAGADIVADLSMNGIAFFRGCSSRNDFLRFACSFMAVRIHRDSDADGVTIIAPGASNHVGTSIAGFSESELHPHTEGSAVDNPPRLLMLSCEQPAHAGGLIRLVDGRDLYRDMAEQAPAMLDALTATRSVYFGGGSGHLGSVFSRTRTGRLTVRLRLDNLVRFAPAAGPHVAHLRRLVAHHTTEIHLDRGEGYVLANDRWLHGRTRFTGHRRMMRLIGDPLPELRIESGFAVPLTAMRSEFFGAV
jgi:alpha-ketoglutarate-dependent taurine dioxygenase